MPRTWVVVAESSRAKIYQMDKKNLPLKELSGFSHTSSRLHEQNLTSDLPGRTHDSHGQASHKLEKSMSSKEHESAVFARSLGQHLDSARTSGKFDKLIIMSPPSFLGQLRKQLSNATNRHVVSEIDKNLVRHSEEEIRQHLPFWF